MYKVGWILAKGGDTVITGGFGGSGMEAPARGATEAGGKAIGYVWRGKPGNPYLTEMVDCRRVYVKPKRFPVPGELPFYEPPPEVQYGIRLGFLLAADGFIIDGSGGTGTLVEMLAVLNLNAKYWSREPKRFSIMTLPIAHGRNHHHQALDFMMSLGIIQAADLRLLKVTADPAEAVNWVTPLEFEK